MLLQHSCLENHVDRGARQTTVHGVSKSRTQLITHVHITGKNLYLKIIYLILKKLHLYIYI